MQRYQLICLNRGLILGNTRKTGAVSSGCRKVCGVFLLSWWRASATFALLASFCLTAFAQTSVTTQHNDLARTGQNLSETILTPSSVSSASFGKLFSLNVDGQVIAQPLYLPGLVLNGVLHNVLFVATEHDSVFAFDADAGGSPLWQASLLDTAHGAAAGATTDPYSDTGCYTTANEWGITGTPVIDPASGTLYVVSLTKENNYPVLRLHALSTTSGAEKFGGPAVIKASVAGNGTGSSGSTLTFDPKWENQRAGLLLVNGTVYIAFAAHCDIGPYHGWLLAYNAATLAQTAVFAVSPNGADAGIWMGAGAPAVDTLNGVTRLFLTTGNGTYDATKPYVTNSMDFGDAILRLDLSNGLQVSDDFTPLNQANLSATDKDLGSSSTLLLPDQPGAHPHLLVEASKGGVIYLVDRDNLGGYSTTTNNVVQEIDNQATSSFGLAAYWNSNVYLWPAMDRLKQFRLSNGTLSSTPVAVSPQVTTALYGVGSTPSISANGTANAIVWTIDTSQGAAQVVYAHDATNVANTLWSSAANSSRDGAGLPGKFGVPTIVNGKVYVGSTGAVMVYGLPNFTVGANPVSLALAAGNSGTATVTVNPIAAFTGNVTFTCSVPTSLANVTCAVPGTVNSSGSVTLTITAGSTAKTPWLLRPKGTGPLFFLAALLLTAACVFARRHKMRFVAAAFALLLMVVLSNCGGGSSSGTPIQTGPVAESGTVTVTGTSGPFTSSANVSVTIN